MACCCEDINRLTTTVSLSLSHYIPGRGSCLCWPVWPHSTTPHASRAIDRSVSLECQRCATARIMSAMLRHHVLSLSPHPSMSSPCNATLPCTVTCYLTQSQYTVSTRLDVKNLQCYVTMYCHYLHSLMSSPCNATLLCTVTVSMRLDV